MNQTIQYDTAQTQPARRRPINTGVFARVNTWLQRSRSRRELSELPAHLLKDIGLSESDRYREISKPFWRR